MRPCAAEGETCRFDRPSGKLSGKNTVGGHSSGECEFAAEEEKLSGKGTESGCQIGEFVPILCTCDTLKGEISMLFCKGVGALLLTLFLFTVFTLKMPRGAKAMSGLANAAIATFLIEAIFKYILGDFVGVDYFAVVGGNSGSLGGSAAAVLVGIAMGTDPVIAVASAVAVKGMGILPGFIAAYALHFAMKPVMKYLPQGIDLIFGALLAAAGAYGITYLVSPGVDFVIGLVGDAIQGATAQSPMVMGFVLGGIIKIVCTSPLSSMALTAMLGLTGLPMGIADIACFGGTFTNGVVFRRLGLGDKSKSVAVMLEPLTQADIITTNPIPIYASNFFGGGFSGMAAAALKIVSDAPGTAAPIPGMLAPFAFNDPLRVVGALGIAAVAGTVAGWLGSQLFLMLDRKEIYLYPMGRERARLARVAMYKK